MLLLQISEDPYITGYHFAVTCFKHKDDKTDLFQLKLKATKFYLKTKQLVGYLSKHLLDVPNSHTGRKDQLNATEMRNSETPCSNSWLLDASFEVRELI
jgi:hypothetical protein